MGMHVTDTVDSFLEQRGWQVIGEFASLLQMRNVTGSAEDLRDNAAEIVRRFDRRGASMEVVELPGAAPVIVGELRCDSPTARIGVYVHYDGQPVDPANWTTAPFSPTLRTRAIHADGNQIDLPGPDDVIDPEWRIYSRSAADDKTPLSAICAALDALSTAGLSRRVDLVFLFEGEEESGSPNLERYMTTLAPRLAADAWLLCDGPVHQSGTPQVAFGARGYSGFDLTFYGPEREVHSGHYGNWVPNPALELGAFLASCKDGEGQVTIEGFYDDTQPMGAADRAAIAALPPVEHMLGEELGFAGPEIEGRSYAERLMLPSFNVRGLRAADVGSAARNIIPSRATASVDMRLAAGDDPNSMVDRVVSHLERAGYLVLDREPTPAERRSHRRLARLDRTVGYRAARIPMDSALARTLLEVCGRAAASDVVALPTFGGSVPLYLFEDILDAPVAILPIANHDNNQHAPDENVRMGNLWYGVRLWAHLLTSDLSALANQEGVGRS
ncbi:MAG: M20/M25/M40 family metallo-hydrolase [Acidimicrobiia bacterium]|jgi:acetylornithine deacetylase/succinyl-diaminopimelate desuccinylase-like protein